MALKNRSVDIDAEMSRFEQEIANATTYSAPPITSNSATAVTYKPPSMHFIPHQIKRTQTNGHSTTGAVRPTTNMSAAMPSSSTMASSSNFMPHTPMMMNPTMTSNTFVPTPHSMVGTMNPSIARPPTFPLPNYTISPMGMPTQIHTVPPINSMPSSSSSSSSGNALVHGSANGSASSSTTDAKKKGAKLNEKGKKPKKFIRAAGGTTWEDSTLQEWESDDFRIFCGDLGNDVNNEILSRAFNKYPSFLKAKVVRDKRTNKTKGYGFVSFKDPTDFIRAMREMNGKYVGSRPIKLRKSCWKDRSLEVAKKKVKEKQKLGLL